MKASSSTVITGVGCVEKGAEDKCLVLRDQKTREIFGLHFSGPPPAVGQAIRFSGSEGIVSTCQQGKPISVTSFTPLRLPCPFVVVYKPDGTLQCEKGTGVPLDTMEQELNGAGVAVLSKRKDVDGRVHPAVCGAASGNVNAFEIPSGDVGRTTKIGFRVLRTRSATADRH